MPGFGMMLVVRDVDGNQVDGYLTVDEFVKMALLRDGKILTARWYGKKKYRINKGLPTI